MRDRAFDLIVSEVSDHHNLRPADVLGRNRRAQLARARQDVMFFALIAGGMNKSDIGRAMGRDHTTVMHGIKRAAVHALVTPDASKRFDALGERVRAVLDPQKVLH